MHAHMWLAHLCFCSRMTCALMQFLVITRELYTEQGVRVKFLFRLCVCVCVSLSLSLPPPPPSLVIYSFSGCLVTVLTQLCDTLLLTPSCPSCLFISVF